MVANGETLVVSGRTILELETDTLKCHQEVVVADINVDGVLGLDFLRFQKSSIDMENDILVINGQRLPLIIRGKIGCSQIYVSDTTITKPLIAPQVGENVRNKLSSVAGSGRRRRRSPRGTRVRHVSASGVQRANK